MAGAQQAQGRVGLCAAKPVHARPTTHSINTAARCDFTTDELMAMSAVRGGAPSRSGEGRNEAEESEERCLLVLCFLGLFFFVTAITSVEGAFHRFFVLATSSSREAWTILSLVRVWR